MDYLLNIFQTLATIAKFMAYNPNFKFVHLKCIPDGDECCEFQIKPTNEKERKDFFSEDADWFYIDKWYLKKGEIFLGAISWIEKREFVVCENKRRN